MRGKGNLIGGVGLVLVLAAGGCGMFDDDEERLEGERIPVRNAREALNAGAPAPTDVPPPETSAY